ncbi:MAG TPA: hypothetical protein VK859_16535, partial [bacterium]|nr:hypothetical protein [bacterium]
MLRHASPPGKVSDGADYITSAGEAYQTIPKEISFVLPPAISFVLWDKMYYFQSQFPVPPPPKRKVNVKQKINLVWLRLHGGDVLPAL